MSIDVLPADLGAGVLGGFTRRAGGVSTGPYSGLNLGLHVGDEAADVEANRALLAAWAGAPVVFPRQVHGTAVLDAAAGDVSAEADAVVAVSPDVAVGVLVADCVPVLLADADAGVVGAAHAGRLGFVAGVVEAVLDAMESSGARRSRVRAAIGPAAGPCCYEVPAAMRDDVGAVRSAAPATTTWGTPSLDLRGGCAEVLRSAGVASIAMVGGCTIEDPDAYSYRRARVTGRFAGVVRLAP